MRRRYTTFFAVVAALWFLTYLFLEVVHGSLLSTNLSDSGFRNFEITFLRNWFNVLNRGKRDVVAPQNIQDILIRGATAHREYTDEERAYVPSDISSRKATDLIARQGDESTVHVHITSTPRKVQTLIDLEQENKQVEKEEEENGRRQLVPNWHSENTKKISLFTNSRLDATPTVGTTLTPAGDITVARRTNTGIRTATRTADDQDLRLNRTLIEFADRLAGVEFRITVFEKVLVDLARWCGELGTPFSRNCVHPQDSTAGSPRFGWDGVVPSGAQTNFDLEDRLALASGMNAVRRRPLQIGNRSRYLFRNAATRELGQPRYLLRQNYAAGCNEGLDTIRRGTPERRPCEKSTRVNRASSRYDSSDVPTAHGSIVESSVSTDDVSWVSGFPKNEGTGNSDEEVLRNQQIGDRSNPRPQLMKSSRINQLQKPKSAEKYFGFEIPRIRRSLNPFDGDIQAKQITRTICSHAELCSPKRSTKKKDGPFERAVRVPRSQSARPYRVAAPLMLSGYHGDFDNLAETPMIINKRHFHNARSLDTALPIFTLTIPKRETEVPYAVPSNSILPTSTRKITSMEYKEIPLRIQDSPISRDNFDHIYESTEAQDSDFDYYDDLDEAISVAAAYAQVEYMGSPNVELVTEADPVRPRKSETEPEVGLEWTINSGVGREVLTDHEQRRRVPRITKSDQESLQGDRKRDLKTIARPSKRSGYRRDKLRTATIAARNHKMNNVVSDY